MQKGYDLSQHQATTPNLAGTSFVVLRATIGTTKDTRYDQHYAAARAAGVVVMAYAFNGPTGSDVAAQAARFLEVASGADFLWLDQERYSSTADGFTDAEAQRFIDEVRKVRPCGLYHSSSGFGGVSCDAKWVADWRDASEQAGYPRTADGKPFPDWTLWQYDGGGADGLDNNYWNPERPIAGLLRKGYVPQQDYDAKVVALNVAEAEIAELNVRLEFKEAANLQLAASLLEAQEDLAAAPGIERERIAQAEAERIRGL